MLYREDLDQAVEGRKQILGASPNPSRPRRELIHYSPCHPHAGLRLIYEEGSLRLECVHCARLAMVLAIAARNPTPTPPLPGERSAE